jgi:hypothetical protein
LTNTWLGGERELAAARPDTPAVAADRGEVELAVQRQGDRHSEPVVRDHKEEEQRRRSQRGAPCGAGIADGEVASQRPELVGDA